MDGLVGAYLTITQFNFCILQISQICLKMPVYLDLGRGVMCVFYFDQDTDIFWGVKSCVCFRFCGTRVFRIWICCYKYDLGVSVKCTCELSSSFI